MYGYNSLPAVSKRPELMKNTSNTNKILALLGLVGIIWPFFYDQEMLSCQISPQACSNAEPLAFWLIIGSITLGSFLVANLITRAVGKVSTRARVISVILLTAAIGIVVYWSYFAVTFSREFHF